MATEIVVTVLTGLAANVLHDIIKIIYKLLKKRKENKKETKPVHIFTLTEEFIITGDRNSKIPEELKKELFD